MNAAIQGFSVLTSFVVNTTSQFQDFNTQSGIALSETADNFNAAVAAFGAGASSVGVSALASQDALIRYNEKISNIQKDIADVMGGGNILTALANYQDTLLSDQQAYAEKVQNINDQISQANADLLTTEQDLHQKMLDTLSNLEETHANTVADKKERQAQMIASTTSTVEKIALQKKYNEENALSEDSYNRQLATKKEQLQRSLTEEEERAKDSADKKVATLNAQLAKEAEMESAKEAKLKENLDDEVARDKAANDKKLSQYNQMLADEERNYILSQERRASGGSGKSGGSSLGRLTILGAKEASPELSSVSDSLQGVHKLIDDISKQSPFTKLELQQTAQATHDANIGFQAMGPTIVDLAAAKGKQPLETLNAIVMATHGSTRQLTTQFGITGDSLNMVLGKVAGNTKFTYDEVLTGIKKVNDQMGNTDAAKTMGDTYSGKLMKVKNELSDVALQIMGVDLAAKNPIEKGGLLDTLTQTAKAFGDWVVAHQKDIVNFFKNLGDIFIFVSRHGELIKGILTVVGGVLGVIAALNIKTFVQGIIAFVDALAGIGDTLSIFAGAPGMISEIGVVFAAIGGPITAIVAAIGFAVGALVIFIITHWNQVKAVTLTVFKAIGDFFTVFWNGIVDFFTTMWGIIEDVWQTALKAVSDAVKDWVKSAQDTWNGFMKFLGDFFKGIGDFFAGLPGKFAGWGKSIAQAFVDAFVNTFKGAGSLVNGALNLIGKFLQGKSPPAEGPLHEIDIWGANIGMAWVKGFQGAIGSVQMPNIGNFGSGLGGTQNYNSVSNLRTSNVTMNNNFQIANQASAQNMVSYLSFASNHFGAV